VLLSLLFYARSKAACWPSDATIGSRVGRSVSTVQRSLRRLQAIGMIERVPDQSEANRTGRRIVLVWRSLAWRGRPTPVSSVTDP
jgi:DNA-binding MarR family transcriptional regulator